MTDFQRLSQMWFAFPGQALIAFRYEKFLNGIMGDVLKAHGVVARVVPADVVKP